MKNLLLFPVILIMIFSCNSSSDPAKPVSDSLAEIINSLRDSIKKYPGDTLLKYDLVIAFQDAGRYPEAIKALDEMNFTKDDSANLKVYFNYLMKRSELLSLSGDTAEAIKTLELFVIPGELTEAGLQLANLYAETNNPKVISICDAMNKNDASGHDPNPDYLKGVYYYNIGDYEKALENFSSCIRKDYTFLDAYMETGRILFKQNKFDDAIKNYDQAISVNNTFADAYLWKAKCQEALGQKEDARLNYQRAYALDKTLTEAKEATEKMKN